MAMNHSYLLALFLVSALGLAGLAHVAWMRTAWAKRLDQSVDFGLTFRGRRIFGDNKTVAGFVVMPLASALAFRLLRPLFPVEIDAALSFAATPGDWLLLGFMTGLGFMLAELPNSFAKRQLDVAPGMEASSKFLRPVLFLADRFDSSIGALCMFSLFSSFDWRVWLPSLAIGVCLHAFFSWALFFFGVKGRAL